MKNNTTACPLDCYDACSIVYEDEKIKASKDAPTHGFLCPHLKHFTKQKTITQASYDGKNISMNEALEKLQEILSSTYKSDILHYRGSGNFGLMQEVTDHFFASYGATLTDGNLCDGAGEAGIIEGRGSNKNMSLQEIEKSEVVIIWGRNPHTTSSHLLPLLKNKTIIVIDPIATKIAKSADLFIQIRPHGDLYLAMLLVRFLHINDVCNEEYLEEFASDFEDYYELTQGIRIKATLEEIDITLGEIGKIIDLIKNKKVAIVCGLGVQKYEDGADVLRAIDAIAVALGLFGKEGCGVAYLGDSKANIDSPFHTQAKRVSKVNTHFDDFKTVFIQGANPLAQMPNSIRVQTAMSRVENIIYFGLYENESSKVANLIIPAKSFLYKDDVRASYSHNMLLFMNKQLQTDIGISEYDLAHYLCQKNTVEIQTEQEYLDYFKKFATQKDNGSFTVTDRVQIPYKNGFDTESQEFLFLEEFDKVNFSTNFFHLITPKSPTSLNSQFHRESHVYIHSTLGYKEGEKLTISSVSGKVTLVAKYNDNLRKDSILIYSGTQGVNNLTTSRHSLDGKNAIFQENRVEILKK